MTEYSHHGPRSKKTSQLVVYFIYIQKIIGAINIVGKKRPFKSYGRLQIPIFVLICFVFNGQLSKALKVL